MKTYLVTGAAGFIGANFLKYILKKYEGKEDIKVVVVDALTYAGNLGTIKEELKDERVKFEKVDIRDRKEIERVFSENDVDFVVNFAAESHVDRSIENPQIFLETNILGTQNLLENAKKAWTVSKDENGYPIYKDGVKYLQVSTDEVYGSLSKDYETAIDLVIEDEEVKKVVKNRTNLKTYGDKFFTEKTPLDPRSPYSASKTGADHIVIAYGETYKMPINITRCSNNYGPYHFPEKLIPLMIKNVLEGKKLPVYGKGDNVRDWLYVEDHCKGIDLVVRNGRLGEVYNIGGFNEEQNINIVKLVIDILKDEITANDEYKKVLKTDLANVNYDLITYVQDRLGHDMRYAIDPSKIVRELGWYPETDFETGIRKTVKWYLENQEWVNEVASGDYQKYYDEMYGNK
ncbi:dTDP-glucose 4,6-dehydratase [Leptotrichia sp. oral taxon 221]|uniref:dTDP-glucose 4,6-dehydratase n=1 Tax=Leptotrichia sp. oral taxon 221 TaxID=712362 RepID=UPI001B8B52A1|nr:dTDP-glucose 4,6-dehydratase [Leptotrichia sp. oral taxon 221]QUB97137.1 dTDP-glucose 4,6-dehydratase [Leptotrichia sp. oral taxon 221]